MTKDELKKKLDEAEKIIKRLDLGVKDAIAQIENEKVGKALLQNSRDDLIAKAERLFGQFIVLEKQKEKEEEKVSKLQDERAELLITVEELKKTMEGFVCLAKKLG